MSLGVRLVYFTVICVLTWAQIIGCIVGLLRIEAVARWRVSVRMAVAGLAAALRRIVEFSQMSGKFAVEANEMGAVRLLAEHKLPFVAGPTLNVFNGRLLRHHRE